MTAEDFDRDVENVGRLPGKSAVQGSTGLLLATISLTGNCRESNTSIAGFVSKLNIYVKKNTLIKRCGFKTGNSLLSALFELCWGGVSKTDVFETVQALMSRFDKLWTDRVCPMAYRCESRPYYLGLLSVGA